ncbi:MAG TPA: mechanosensitive ion channel family protein [Alphaproteobacteria bacterium]
MDELTRWLAHYGVDIRALIASLAILIAGSAVIWSVARFLHGLIRRLEPRVRVPYETALILMRVVVSTLWILLGALILNVWGISLTGLWAFLVSAATVIGVGFLATWTMISNVTANLFITIWRPFRLGETVEVLPENLKGRVVDRNLMFTTLREERGSVLQVPNSLFFQKIFRVSDTTEEYLFEALRTRAVAPDTVPGNRDPQRN